MKHLESNTPSTLSHGKHNEYQVMSEHKRNAYVFYFEGKEIKSLDMSIAVPELMAEWDEFWSQYTIMISIPMPKSLI
jgi:hypothetical protein